MCGPPSARASSTRAAPAALPRLQREHDLLERWEGLEVREGGRRTWEGGGDMGRCEEAA